MRFLLLEAVAPIDALEMGGETQTVDDGLDETYWLVGKHGHLDPGGVELVENVAHTGIERGVVEHMLAIIRQKILKRALDGFVRIRGPQRFADQHGRAVADVGVNKFIFDGREAEMGARGVYRIGQILARIDERAVQIENEQGH